jgi:hypothetical protein
MARDKLATAAIAACRVVAVSTLPALLIASSIPEPVVRVKKHVFDKYANIFCLLKP